MDDLVTNRLELVLEFLNRNEEVLGRNFKNHLSVFNVGSAGILRKGKEGKGGDAGSHRDFEWQVLKFLLFHKGHWVL